MLEITVLEFFVGIVIIIILSAFLSYPFIHSFLTRNDSKAEKYKDLCTRQRELIVLIKRNVATDGEKEEFGIISKKLREIDLSIPRRTIHATDYNKGFDELEKSVSEINAFTLYKASTNNINRVLSGRPDLSFLTSKSFKDHKEFWNFCYEANARNRWGFDKAKMIGNAEKNIPQLVAIAEMYYDSMVGTDAEGSLPFHVVNETINSIADVKK